MDSYFDAGCSSTPRFLGVIPGGQSFQIPVPPATQLTPLSGGRVGFNWTAAVRAGTTLIILAGDDRGPGTGGGSTNIVSYGTSAPITDCLNDATPSSTLGTPPGWSNPTNTPGSSPSPAAPSGNV